MHNGHSSRLLSWQTEQMCGTPAWAPAGWLQGGAHVHPLDSNFNFFATLCYCSNQNQCRTVMRVLSHITLKSKIHLLNYSGIWYTARHPHIAEEYWSYGPRLCTPCKKILRAPLGTCNPCTSSGYAYSFQPLLILQSDNGQFQKIKIIHR